MSAEVLNQDIAQVSPATAALLSPLGRAAVYPPDIPFQAAQARGKRYNATIGQITDGAGAALALSSVRRALAGLGSGALDESVLYSPVEGRPELRDAWSEHHRPPGFAAEVSRPLVTVGLTGALALVADLFVGPETTVLVPAPFWGNYRQIFGLRRGGDVRAVEIFEDGRWAPERLIAARAALPEGSPVAIILNLPSNPVGYSPTVEQRASAIEALLKVAEHGPLLVICDDAYAGLVHEEEIPAESMFWSLVGLHPSLVPVKVDGATKELVLFGGRVGFLTFPFAGGSSITEALDSKAKCILRATVGSPVAVSQRLALDALRDPATAGDLVEIRRELAERYRALKVALADTDPALLRPLPFNSGCFAVVGLPVGVDPEAARRRLLDEYDTGVVALASGYLRIAYCSVRTDALGEVVRRVESAVRDLAGAAVAGATAGR